MVIAMVTQVINLENLTLSKESQGLEGTPVPFSYGEDLHRPVPPQLDQLSRTISPRQGAQQQQSSVPTPHSDRVSSYEVNCAKVSRYVKLI